MVAVDDGSIDGSGERLESRARADPRVRVLRTPRRGLVSALNLALAEARAPLVARMDADDLSRRDRLSRQCARLEADPGVDVLGSRVELRVGPEMPPAPGMRAYVEWDPATRPSASWPSSSRLSGGGPLRGAGRWWCGVRVGSERPGRAPCSQELTRWRRSWRWTRARWGSESTGRGC